MTDTPKMEPSIVDRIKPHIFDAETTSGFIPSVGARSAAHLINNAFRDGAKAERDRTRERDAAKDAVVEWAREAVTAMEARLGWSLAHDQLRKKLVALDALDKADPT